MTLDIYGTKDISFNPVFSIHYVKCGIKQAAWFKVRPVSKAEKQIALKEK